MNFGLCLFVLLVGKAWGMAGPPILSIIGHVGGQIPD
jgi:hypothetical protein